MKQTVRASITLTLHDIGIAYTYTLCSGDVHVTGDERQTVVHADLQINHPGRKPQQTHRKTVSGQDSGWAGRLPSEKVLGSIPLSAA